MRQQAAIRGLPKLGKEDEMKVMGIIIALRGLDKKKHKEEWKDGNLKNASNKVEHPRVSTGMEKGSRKWRSVE